MITSDLRNELLTLINGYSQNTDYGFGSSTSDYGSLSTGQDPFQLMLAQMLVRLLDRLDGTPTTSGSSSALSGTTTSGTATGTVANGRTPVPLWIYPTTTAATPNTQSVAAQQAYGLPNGSAASPAVSVAAASSDLELPEGVMALGDYPHPPADNGRGMHWIPTVSQTPEVVDRYVEQLKAMHIKWVTFLNDGTNIGSNDYLVQQLKANGMEPVMRVYVPGLSPIDGDLGAMVRHYKELGVSYFQLYNEPNHSVENNGQYPDVNRYLDAWIPAAQTVSDNGGLPGFGALSPGGDFADTEFLSQAIDGLKARGQLGLLDKAWLVSHNYQGDRAIDDTGGFARFRVYADILQNKLGRLLPIIGTEGGSFVTEAFSEAQRTATVTQAYQYMSHREPYNFAYSYWVIANQAGGGHDPAWEWQALIHDQGQSPLVQALINLEAA